MTSLPASNDAWVARQRAIYGGGFYRRLRRLRWLLRYDCRYRVLLMEELFREHDIPFERMLVYELGFGTGDLLLRFDTTSTLHGCELSEEAVDALRADRRTRGYAETCFVTADGNGAARFPASDYDMVIASHVLEHVPNDRATLEALAAHVRPGGHGLFFLPLERPRHNPDHARVYTTAGLRHLLARTGWDVVSIEENFRYASHVVQVLNWPSRARIPVAGAAVESVKNVLLSLPPTAFVRLCERPLEALHVAPRQIMALARKAEVREA